MHSRILLFITKKKKAALVIAKQRKTKTNTHTHISYKIRNKNEIIYPVDDFLMVSNFLLCMLFSTCPLNGGISGTLDFKDFTNLLLHAL